MEAKDTVMNGMKLLPLIDGKLKSNKLRELPDVTPLELALVVAKAQAEISFKAGEEEEYKRWVKACMKAGMLISKPEQLVNRHKTGIKEVVDWLSARGMLAGVNRNLLEWQSKLKEWGL